jgi:hypothetical protein
MDEVIEKLERIKELWGELARTKVHTPEYGALMSRIRALSAEYQALIDTPKAPKRPDKPK